MNNYILPFFLYIVFQIYNLAHIKADPAHYSRMRNNMLRLYVYHYPSPLRKKALNKFGQIVGQTGTTLNLYMMDANAKYYSLSEEDRLIIETAISLLY